MENGNNRDGSPESPAHRSRSRSHSHQRSKLFLEEYKLRVFI